MPHRKNAKADIGSAKRFSDTHDMDNIYLSEEGWVYRHFKNVERTLWWDEILVAGQVKPGHIIADVNNNPVAATNPLKLGTHCNPNGDGGANWDVGGLEFEHGDRILDYRYSDHEGALDKEVPGDTTDFEQTAWESINAPDAADGDEESQVPSGWTGVSSPKIYADATVVASGEDYISINNYTIESEDSSVPPEVVPGTFEDGVEMNTVDVDYEGDWDGDITKTTDEPLADNEKLDGSFNPILP